MKAAERYGSGHINETYLARYATKHGEQSYIHQKINGKIFPDVPGLMNNIGRVTRHLRQKLERAGAEDIERRVLTLVPTVVSSESDVCQLGDGAWWRTYLFIGHARTYDTIDDPERAYQAAKAFGLFVAALADLRGERLHETIPGFHDTNRRFTAFLEALALDPKRRARCVRAEIAYAMRNETLVHALASFTDSGLARECVTHNDTKLNNVMIDDRTSKGICVIDLDTVMPGLALFDFGDMARTATSPTTEDERDLSLVGVRALMFQAVARGFIEGAGSMLTSDEYVHMVTAARVSTFECGIRFLTDYLLGDVYFRTHREDQNLDRARTQFSLVDSFGRHEERLTRSILEMHSASL